MTRSSKLKRRTPVPAPSVKEPVAEDEGSQEPPLKKFKAFFNASDLDKMSVDPHTVEGAYDRDEGFCWCDSGRPEPHPK